MTLMRYKRMPIEIESPEQIGYGNIKYNLTESSIRDKTLKDFGLELDINSLLLQYGDHRGHPGLRQLLAKDGATTPEHVLLTPGAAGALFIIATSLLSANDHLIVLRPNYATNIETPRAIGCEVSFVELTFENNFQYTANDIAKHVKPNTKLISITVPHNPTGTVLPWEELKKIVALAEEHNCWLLLDETYRGLGNEYPLATTLSKCVLSVGSLSKSYGLPGLRLGWLITRDDVLAETFLAAKEQIVITGPIIEEEIAYQVYKKRNALLNQINQERNVALQIVKDWLANEPMMEWVEPSGGVVCFPRIKHAGVDVEAFHKRINELGAFVGPGHWFEQEKRYMRIGYAWPTLQELRTGLETISQALRETIKD
jgi:aspartate/methionine/tyrosine aminotransferase